MRQSMQFVLHAAGVTTVIAFSGMLASTPAAAQSPYRNFAVTIQVSQPDGKRVVAGSAPHPVYNDRSDFAVMTGNGTVLLDALRAGATGGILAVGCVVPEVCVEIYRAFNAGEEEHAAMLQSKLTPLAAAVTTRFGIGGLKAALDLAGYRGGAVRAPLGGPDESARNELVKLIANLIRNQSL